MQLYPSGDSIYSPDVVFENSVGLIDYQTDRVYSGILEGDLSVLKSKSNINLLTLDDKNARVYGILDAKGVFDGHVDAHDDVFFIEPSEK